MSRGDGRADRFRWQRHAAKLLEGQGRVGLCRWSVVSKAAGVDLVRTMTAGVSRAHYEGTQTCGSVWLCPCCGARISETRREELNKLLSWARAQGYGVWMVTETARHSHADDLANMLDGMKDARRRARRHRAYARLKPGIVGTVVATEVTGGGRHGWHVHFHTIIITRGEVDLSPLRQVWLASLRGAGLDGTGAGWDLRDAAAVGSYVAKWGAAEEITLTTAKRGRVGGGRTPAQLLAASCDEGDRRARALWLEYARVFPGRRQLVWSDGLKQLAGIDEVDDADAAKDDDAPVEVDRANIPHPTWKTGVATPKADRRAAVLDRAEEVGAEQAVAEVIDGVEVDPLADLIEELVVTDPPPEPAVVIPPPGVASFDIDRALADLAMPPRPPL